MELLLPLHYFKHYKNLKVSGITVATRVFQSIDFGETISLDRQPEF